MVIQTLPTLPPELRIHIAKHLRTDTAALKVLSVTSHDWLAPAQMSLFEDLHTVIDEPDDMQGLLALFRSSSCLGTYIRRLCISGKAGRGDPRVLLTIVDVLALLALLPNLQGLTTHACHILDSPHMDPVIQSTVLHPCKLFLSYTSIDERALHNLLRYVPIVHFSAIVLDVVVPNRSKPAAFESSVFAEARTMDIGWRLLYSFPERLHSELLFIRNILQACPGTLRSVGLIYDLRDGQRVRAMCNFLETKGRHIENLRMDYGYVTAIQKEAPDIDLPSDHIGADGFGRMFLGCKRTVNLSECCPRLTAFTCLLFVAKESGDEVSDAIVEWRYALRLLASAPRSLTHITLGIILVGSEYYDDTQDCTIDLVQWRQWDELLREFKALERLDVVQMDDEPYFSMAKPRLFEPRRLFSDYWRERLERSVAEELSSVKGLLHFT